MIMSLLDNMQHRFVVPISYSTISTMSRFNIEDSDMFNSADKYVVIEKQVDIIKKQVTLKGVLHV